MKGLSELLFLIGSKAIATGNTLVYHESIKRKLKIHQWCRDAKTEEAVNQVLVFEFFSFFEDTSKGGCGGCCEREI